MELSHSQAFILRRLFEENRICNRYLIGKEFTALLDQNLAEYYPFPESLFEGVGYLDDVLRLIDTDPIRALNIVESESPFLLNRDLAAIALMRKGDFSLERSAKMAGLMATDEGRSMLAVEAALSLTHWRNWSKPLSKWFDWKNFLDAIEYGLEIPAYAAWSSCAYVWAFTRQGGEISMQDHDYGALVESLKSQFETAEKSRDPELQRACEIALNQWGDIHTLSDQAGQ